MEKCNNHGGKREGAGRKASGKVRGTHTLTLSPEAAEKLKAVGRDKSEYIDRLIMEDIKKTMIDRVCNWLQHEIRHYVTYDGEIELQELIDDFRKEIVE
ncbi:MAG: hypothetical protein IKJ48_07750 [Alistipes sp.]|nr:hypothetical protein [Alistipes sp.]